MAQNTVGWFRRISNQRFFKFGIPFLVLMVVGSFGLKGFTTFRYEYRKAKLITPEQAEHYGLTRKKTKSLEEEYEEYKKRDVDTWQNIRGPRPWEDSKEIQDLQRKNMRKQ